MACFRYCGPVKAIPPQLIANHHFGLLKFEGEIYTPATELGTWEISPASNFVKDAADDRFISNSCFNYPDLLNLTSM